MTIAAQRVELGYGDGRRDRIAQRFCNALAFEWTNSTGKLPTHPKTNPNSKSLSPFQNLLVSINTKFLPGELRSPNNFASFAVKSVAAMKREFPELKRLRQLPGRK
jgi:hypothetical protein